MKKYLFGILFIVVALAGNSFAQDRRADFSMSEPTKKIVLLRKLVIMLIKP